jgi:AmiR/NasT family two-component response regulator
VAPRADDPRDEGREFHDRSAALNEARRRIENLEIALQTNRRIGVAIGILMSRHGTSEERAFEMLAQASQLSNRKLREIADAVAYEGDLPRQSAEGSSQSDFGAVG